ncbi:MAG: hypothetical protein JRE72_12060 [Deltaproteobacteria bacterium]|jgi:hypothetical protein|nr:hypothetical protein [Deltaproteobacteria bacterium]
MVLNSESGIPWASRQSWRAAHQAIRYHLRRHAADLKPLNIRAQTLESCLKAVFTILDELCAASCPWCPDPCCLKASVWFDFKDLLYMHFNQLSIPPCQPKTNLKNPCCYHGHRGCRLPRINRPWICTWYLCPTQMAILRKDHPAERESLKQAFSQIKSERNQLESDYFRIIS